MALEEQEQSAQETEPTVTDPLDAVNSTDGGTNAMDDYQAEVEAALRQELSDEQGEQPADQDDDESQDFTEQSDEAESQTDESDEDEVEPEAKTKDRFRFKDPLDQKIAAVAKAMGVNLMEAAKIVEGQNPTKHQESTQEYSQEYSQESGETVDSVQARLEELEEMDAQASADLQFEVASEHRKEANKLRNKLMDLKIAEVQSKARTEQAESAKFYADYEKSEVKTVGLYPDAAVANSPLANEMARIEAEMQELGDPLYHSTDKPFILAREAAKNLGIPMRKPGSAPVRKTAQHRPIQPAGGNARTTAADPARRATEAIDGLQSMRDYHDMVASL